MNNKRFLPRIAGAVGLVARRKQRGLSLAEAGLVLALGMLAAVLAFGAYSTGSRNITTGGQVTAALELQNNITRAYYSATDYTGLDNTVIANSGLLPKNFRASSTVTANTGLRTAWGELVVEARASDPSQFEITFSNVPADVCMDFITGIASGENVIGIGSDTVKTASTALDITLAANSCSPGGPRPDILLMSPAPTA